MNPYNRQQPSHIFDGTFHHDNPFAVPTHTAEAIKRAIALNQAQANPVVNGNNNAAATNTSNASSSPSSSTSTASSATTSSASMMNPSPSPAPIGLSASPAPVVSSSSSTATSSNVTFPLYVTSSISPPIAVTAFPTTSPTPPATSSAQTNTLPSASPITLPSLSPSPSPALSSQHQTSSNASDVVDAILRLPQSARHHQEESLAVSALSALSSQSRRSNDEEADEDQSEDNQHQSTTPSGSKKRTASGASGSSSRSSSRPQRNLKKVVRLVEQASDADDKSDAASASADGRSESPSRISSTSRRRKNAGKSSALTSPLNEDDNRLSQAIVRAAQNALAADAGGVDPNQLASGMDGSDFEDDGSDDEDDDQPATKKYKRSGKSSSEKVASRRKNQKEREALRRSKINGFITQIGLLVNAGNADKTHILETSVIAMKRQLKRIRLFEKALGFSENATNAQVAQYLTDMRLPGVTSMEFLLASSQPDEELPPPVADENGQPLKRTYKKRTSL